MTLVIAISFVASVFLLFAYQLGWFAQAKSIANRYPKIFNIAFYVFIALIGLIIAGKGGWIITAVTGIGILLIKTLYIFRHYLKYFISKKALAFITTYILRRKYRNYQHKQPHPSDMRISDAMRILQVTPPFSEKQIKIAHRRLMQKHHPDKGGSPEYAIKINKAKEVLMQSIT